MAKQTTLKASKSKPQTMEDLLASTGYEIRGLKKGQTVEGVITGIASKAVLVDIGAKTEGVVVDREFEATRSFIKTLKVGDKISAQVYNPENDTGQILLSFKRTAFSLAWESLQEAQKKHKPVSVLVKGTSRAGLLAEISGLTGIIPTSQVASIWQGKLNELVGKQVEVEPIEVDREQERLVFSERAVSEKDQIDKAKAAIKKIRVGANYKGKVVNIIPFGVFVEVKVGKVEVEGLVHISEISWEKVDDINQTFKLGDEVKVKVIGADKQTTRLSLSMKQLQIDPWQEKTAKYKVDAHLKGKVVKLTGFGAFIEIEPGIEGLIHITKIPADRKINVGDNIDCFVETVEPERRRLSLGLALTAKPVGYK